MLGDTMSAPQREQQALSGDQRGVDRGVSHAALVDIAAKWLKRQGCNVVLTERGGVSAGEMPDAIGWRCSGFSSVVVECKVSLSDFRADQGKPHRSGLAAMGVQRWYLVPSGMLGGQAIPEEWGLLEWTGRVVRQTLPAPKLHREKRSIPAEARLLLSELRIYHAQGIQYRKGVERWGTR